MDQCKVKQLVKIDIQAVQKMTCRLLIVLNLHMVSDDFSL